MIAAQHMHVILLVRTVKHASNKIIINGHFMFANRTAAGKIIFQTAVTAFDMNKVILTPYACCIGNRFYKFAPQHYNGTNRANLRIAWPSSDASLSFAPRKIRING